MILHTFLCTIFVNDGVIEMATNLRVDDELINRAVKRGKHKTKEAAVRQALREYVGRLEQEEIVSLFGTIDYDTGYDYKKQRGYSYR